MGSQLDTGKFLYLKKQELGSDESELIAKLEVCTQSIYRWLQYCQYHYVNLDDAVKEPNLRLDRAALSLTRAGETVAVRYVYEANIVGFLHSLHALLDSFPYLLNLFIPVIKDFESTSIKWHQSFIDKYREQAFHSELTELLMDSTFHKVKGYANTIKHKHLIRILNHWDHLEFDVFSYKRPYLDEDGVLKFSLATVSEEHVIPFIQDCHNELIPKFFNLCESVLSSKICQLENDL